MGLIYCSECGKQISDKAKVCPNCGAPKITTGIYCSECGKQISENAVTCPNCGAPRQSSSWSSLLPSEESSIRKSLVYALICMSLMLIFAFAPMWFGLLGLYGETDYSSDFLFQHLIQNPNYVKNEMIKTAIWGFAWWVLFVFFIIKTYLRSGALDVEKPVKHKIGLVRNIVFIVIGIIAIIHFVKGFIDGIKQLHVWNELMADNLVKLMYGVVEDFFPSKYVKASLVTPIVSNALNSLFFGLITLLEVFGLSLNYKGLHAPQEVYNSSEA